MTDTFEHFGDQQFSHEVLERNRTALRDEARGFVAQASGVEPVGLILDAGAAEAKPFLEALEQATGRQLNVPGFLGVVPRPFAVHILRASCPAALDNLPNGELGVKLPVLVATKGGFRFGEVDYSDAC
ncbi:MAG: hypothetical protein H6832_18990 [Planctomycetes bacterium]|nr:hypothetical protein [Planctomycetota bacterium]MCB9920497.1 hypothetical protein [Planctomycetota bacterium]